jgi:hypothetical protein
MRTTSTTTLNTTTAENAAVETIPSSFEFAQGGALSPAAIEAARVMAAVLEQQPELCRCGFYHYERRSKETLEEYQAFFAAEREALREAAALQQFKLARLWLRKCPTSRKSHSCSYYLKHLCEHEVGVYITNGALIAAALAERFQIQRVRNSPNALG